MKDVVYVTGNPEKAANFSRHMGVAIPHQRADLDEIQTLNIEELLRHKAEQAYAQIGRPVLIEDIGFKMNALGALPGPFVKYFVQAENGVNNMCHMLDGFDDRSATAYCTFAYYDGQVLQLIHTELNGSVAPEPRGNDGFGFDRIFVPDGFGEKTAAELDEKEYDRYYSSVKPFGEVKKFLGVN